jgi:hemerythrin
MSTIAWNDNLASGSTDIDTQHKELFDRINALLAAFDKKTVDRQEISKIVQFLTDYVVFHFGNEEKYMAKFNYSSMSAHKAQHEQFVKGFMKLKDRMLLEGINPALALETKELCVDWLINHIKFSDRALGMYLKHKM